FSCLPTRIRTRSSCYPRPDDTAWDPSHTRKLRCPCRTGAAGSAGSSSGRQRAPRRCFSGRGNDRPGNRTNVRARNGRSRQQRRARRKPVMRLLLSLIGMVLVNVLPLSAEAASVHARFDLDDRRGAPFPSDRFTTEDPSQNTGRRVNLPKPDCGTRPSDCDDLDVINALDGFNVQPRLSIPFDGAIDAASVSSQTVFIVRLGSTLRNREHDDQNSRQIIGINQVVWDVATNTLHAESDEILDQHTRYALIVTRGVRDTQGHPVEAAE